MRERKPTAQGETAEENRIKATSPSGYFLEHQSCGCSVLAHAGSRAGLVPARLACLSVPQFPHQLNRNIFLNPKLTHKVSSWLSGNEGKGRRRGGTPQKQNHIMKTMSSERSTSTLGFGKPREVLCRRQRQFGRQGPERSLGRSRWQSADIN